MDYLEPRFRLKDVAVAADFSVNTLRSYYQRGWFKSFGNALGQGKGRAQQLSLGDALVLAITSRLVGIGMSPLDAYNAAYAFRVTTKTPRGMPKRKPFELFDGEKFDSLFVWTAGAAAQVLPVKKGAATPISPLPLDHEFGEPTIALLLNPIERIVFGRLGLPPPGQHSYE